ncbi:hypothetical protein M409DRAFT_70922 [Zasmidium cellare ATCC 36951]|uniref:Uncharacterized protein n=1 Tax=Zasmidium cellare ATCC 36951 TaxID=1080233 RepID=A0A6A6BXT8_ZASCE|nr:uncharacterized protein M409DRAFT_70922 [Zasmidium cellare ATCC 36951]KAF2159611.1 hypothetical protein M409DRAFT_70922 [Zasmidium cellare ATCC 36951]
MGFVYSQLVVQLPYPTGSYAGKTVVVTGSNTGLGKEAARHYARLGASRLILAVRSIDKGNAAKADIESTTSCGKNVIEVWQPDLGSYASVKDFAANISSDLERVDIFNANAGLARKKYHTAEDNEETITVNVVSTFLLAALVLPKLKETMKRFNVRPTLAITSSGGHTFAKFPQKDAPEGQIFSTINDPNASSKVFAEQYPLSKMLEIFAVRSVGENDPGVTVNCIDPGFCESELARDQDGIFFPLMKFFLARTTEKGSRTLIHAGSRGSQTHGKYLSNCKIAEPSDIVTGPEGKKLQERLWIELTQKLENIQPGVTANFRA